MSSRFNDETSNKLLMQARLEALRSGSPRGWRRLLPRAN